MNGHVLWFDAVKAYGFITGDDRRTYFVHRTAVLDDAELTTGARVEFEATETPRGPRAERIVLVGPQPTPADGGP